MATPAGGGSRVQLGGFEVDARVLDSPADVENEHSEPAAALRRLIADPAGWEPVPATAWLVLDQSADRVAFASYADDWDGWVVVTVERDATGTWTPSGVRFGVRPEATRVHRGAGLTLTWAQDEFVVHEGEYPQLAARLRNERTESWSDDRGEYWVVASVLKLDTGQPVAPKDEIAIAGVGRRYDLAPGGTVDLPVALGAYHDRLPPGAYALIGHVWDLALETQPGRLRVLPQNPQRPK